MSKANDMRIMYHKKKFEVYFGESIPDRQEERRNKLIYPEELLDKKCGGCVRCKVRDHAYYGTKAEGYHCMKMSYDRDISPDDKACVDYWDRAEDERLKKLHEQDIENRRKELWAIYEKRDPVKLPIVEDGFGGRIPQCPICGEMPYDTEQCHWCGQRFIQDKKLKKYCKEEEWYEDCPSCGGKNTMKVGKSNYNGHKHGYCSACGMRWME